MKMMILQMFRIFTLACLMQYVKMAVLDRSNINAQNPRESVENDYMQMLQDQRDANSYSNLISSPYGRQAKTLRCVRNINRKNGEYEIFDSSTVILSRYRIDQVVGRGTYGVVVKAKDLCTLDAANIPLTVAIKILFGQGQGPTFEDDLGNVQRPQTNLFHRDIELNAFDTLNNQCEHCILVLSAFELRNATFIVMPYYSQTLKDLVLRGRGSHVLKFRSFRDIVWQIFSGLECLHRHGLVHNDLKPDNILLEQKNLNTGDDRYTVRLADFSLTCHVGTCEWFRVSPFYEAPEVTIMAGKSYQSSDVWSAGLVLAEMIHGRPILPFLDGDFRLYAIYRLVGRRYPDGFAHINHAITANIAEFFRTETEYSSKSRHVITLDRFITFNHRFALENFDSFALLRNLILKCLELDPSRRITATQALQHPFFHY